MARLTASELNDLHEELQRLLILGQPPVIAVLLRLRFLLATRELGESVWSGYGLPVALAMAKQVALLSRDGIPAGQLIEIDECLRRTLDLPAPPWPGASAWPRAREDALAALHEALCQRVDFSEGPATDTQDGRADIYIPVVAEVSDGANTLPLFAELKVGQLLRLRVEVDVVEGPSPESQLSLDGDTAAVTRSAFAAALGQVWKLRTWGAPAVSRCLFRARWDAPGGRLVGRSGSLGFLLAAAAARASLSAGPGSHQLARRLAATGDLDGTHARSVDPTTLAHKVLACFDSPVEILIVPRDQEREAQAEAERLAETGSRRRLTIIGAEDVAKLWQSRFVVVRGSRSAGATAHSWIRWFFRSRLRMALVAAVFLMLVGASVREILVSRKDPVEASWQQDDLVLKNRYGRAWRVRTYCSPGDYMKENSFVGWSKLVMDLDGDGRNEVLLIHCTPDRERVLMTAIEGDGRVRWSRRSLDLGSSENPDLSDVTWINLFPLEPDPGTGVALLAMRRSRQHSLTLVDVIDGATGKEIGTLRNHGHMETLYRDDFDGDGLYEDAILGTDGIRGLAAFVDPSKMSCRSDWSDLGQIPTLVEPAALGMGVVAAWRFQNDRFSQLERATCISMTREGDWTAVAVEGGLQMEPVLYYFFPRELRSPEVRSVQISDAYRATIRQSQSAPAGGSREAEEFAQEEQRLGRQVETLTDSGWVPVPYRVEILSETAAGGH